MEQMGVLQALAAPLVATRATESIEPRSEACLNCGTPLVGPFCAQCGQRDVPPYPTVRELAVDAFWELSGWDGRFASTIRALTQRPGLLTREFLEGRRARYLSPLRLYLMTSLLYFVVAAAAPELNVRSVGSPVPETGAGPTQTTRPKRVAIALNGSLIGKTTLTPAQRDAALKDTERAPALMRPFLRRAIADPIGFKRGLVVAMPRMLFALLPIFAAILALFYRGRRYPEHLYFAIHLHAFIFLALTIPKLAQFTGLVPLAVTCGVLALLTIPVYTTLALRRVYGGSIVRTLAKEVVIGMIYGTVSLVAFVCVVYWVSVAG
jgi:hypothetical protein